MSYTLHTGEPIRLQPVSGTPRNRAGEPTPSIHSLAHSFIPETPDDVITPISGGSSYFLPSPAPSGLTSAPLVNALSRSRAHLQLVHESNPLLVLTPPPLLRLCRVSPGMRSSDGGLWQRGESLPPLPGALPAGDAAAAARGLPRARAPHVRLAGGGRGGGGMSRPVSAAPVQIVKYPACLSLFQYTLMSCSRVELRVHQGSSHR